MATKNDQLRMVQDVENETVTVEFQIRRGDEFVTEESKTFSFADLPREMATKVSLYGLAKFLADRTSDSKKLGIVGKAKLEWMQEYYDRLMGGNWGAERSGAGKASAGVDVFLAMVVAKKKKIKVEQATAALAALEKDKYKALAAKFKDEVKAMKEASQTSEETDLDDLLDD